MADAREPSRDAARLEALADAGDALTRALVERDLDGILAATAQADRLVAAVRESAPDTSPSGAQSTSRRRSASELLALGERVAAGARRNALLLERAWATDAALLRVIAMATRPEPAAAGPGYAPAIDAEPAGWLDRSA